MRKGAGGVAPLVSLERRTRRPLQSQIYEALRSAIAERRLGAGARIPSTRALAVELHVSRIPVLNAYAQLLAEGYLESRTGAGTFVSSSLPGVAGATGGPKGEARHAKRGARKTAARALRIPRYEQLAWLGGQGAFNLSEADTSSFPFRAWARLAARYWRTMRTRPLVYGDAKGLRELREAIAGYLRAARSVRCEWEQILIVSGSQQGLDLTARVLLEEEDAAWIEEPGYWLAREALASIGNRIVPVPVDAEGLVVARGIEMAPRARAAFVAPSHQFPLGATMSASRRMQLLEWAEKAGAWIVEDDYDSEYRYDNKPIASLQGLDRSERVIYVGTFSKVMFPALRVGYVVAPGDLADRFAAVRHAMDVSPAHQNQAVLAEFIREGHFSRHIRRMRQIYDERREELVRCVQEELGDAAQIHGARAGMYLTVTLGKGYRDREVSAWAAKEGLWLWPLSQTYAGRAARQGFVLGFGGTPAREIAPAVGRLKQILRARGG